MDLNLIWEEFLKIVNEEAGSRVVETWFKAVSLATWEVSTKTVYLKAPNTFVKDWITSNYLSLFKLHLSRLLNEININIVFIDQTKSEISITPAVSLYSGAPVFNYLPNQVNQNKKSLVSVKKNLLSKGNVHPEYQFNSFVVGPNNSLAYAASKAVADKPGTLYNPLFIYGDSGLGKTHLLHAIANYIRTENNKIRILYQSADRFVNEFINAIRFDKINIFENKYKNIDVLLIDDIQFISNKEQTQEAFFHIFNTLYESKKQIVFSSDSLPKDIAGLAERLRSRLDGGLVTDIQKPSLETKIAILKKKAESHQQTLNDDVAYFIACRSSSNVRELEGLLIRVLAFSSLTHQEISLELAQKILFKTSKDESKKQILDLQLIAKAVAKHYDFTLNDLRSSKRIKAIVLARHVAMYLIKKYTECSLTEIGTFFKRKDHSTVIHALEKIDYYKKLDELFCQDIQKLENKIINSNL